MDVDYLTLCICILCGTETLRTKGNEDTEGFFVIEDTSDNMGCSHVVM
jgi:hypothetical protein